MKDSQFSQREKDVIDLLIQGKSNKQIALTLHVAESTIEYHLKNIYQKLDVHSRTEAVLRLGKSIGADPPGELRESIVEIDRRDVDNDDKSFMLRRFPMKQKSLVIAGLFVLIFSLVAVSILRRIPAQATAITPTNVMVPTVAPATDTAPAPTSTTEPTVTNTPEPTVTPILLPDTLNSTFSNVSIVHRDSFEYADAINGALPAGWECDQQFAAWITKDNQFQIQPAGGTAFWFSKERITPSTGVYFTFKYAGSQENFTLGFDNIDTNGDRIHWQDTNFRSVVMDVRNQTPIVYRNFGGASTKGGFQGSLRLQEDTWYNIALAFDENQNYLIKVWQPEAPEQQITYLMKWEDYPHEYYFIGWVSPKRSLLIDDFTVFTFEEIVQK
jgi:DNA-binding CsgD family transcriptional regulator